MVMTNLFQRKRNNLFNKRIKVLSIPPSQFMPFFPDTQDCDINEDSVKANTNGQRFSAPLNLPHGSRMLRANFVGNVAAGDETWKVSRTPRDGVSTGLIIDANFNSGTILMTRISATIDNYKYTYSLFTSSIDTNDEIWGGWIEYEEGEND